MRHKVDPAALLVAVLAAGAGPFLEPGEWSMINTVTAGIVFVTVVCFSWPRHQEPGEASVPDLGIVVAQSIVYGFTFAVALAWPIQEMWRGHVPLEACYSPEDTNDEVLNQTNYLRNGACNLTNSETLADRATDWALTIGLLVTIASFTILLGAVDRIRRRLRRAAGPN